MAPTRELAKQVGETFEMFASSQLNVLCVYGGTPIFPQGLSTSIVWHCFLVDMQWTKMFIVEPYFHSFATGNSAEYFLEF